MNVFRMKKHHAKSLRWKMNTDSFLMKSGFLFSILLLSFCAASCSDDDEQGKGRAFFQTYWALDANNSSMPCGGTLWTQYSDAPVGSEVGKLVDNDLDTKYVTYHSNVNINWNGNSSVSVKSYSLTSAADSPEADPKSWTLSGSSDNQKWVVLDTQKDQTFAERKQTKTYAVENEEEYRYYRLSIQSNHGASSTQLAELSLAASAFVGDIDDLMSKSSGSTYSPDNVMGTQHAESDLSVTQEKLLWLKDPNKEPDPFAGLSWAGFQVSNLYPFGEPCPADVNQHSIGDCCLCAVMGSLSYVYPGFIKNIIKNNGNQTFTVKLYDPKGQQIEVGVSNLFVGTSGSLGASSGKSGQPTWSTVLEKAVIKWFQAFRNTSDIGGMQFSIQQCPQDAQGVICLPGNDQCRVLLLCVVLLIGEYQFGYFLSSIGCNPIKSLAVFHKKPVVILIKCRGGRPGTHGGPTAGYRCRCRGTHCSESPARGLREPISAGRRCRCIQTYFRCIGSGRECYRCS